MRLGDKTYIGVQSLGREDVGATGSLARQEMATVQSFNNLVQTGLDQAGDILDKLNSNESDMLLTEQLRKDRKKILELNTYFDSQPAIDIEGDMPDAVREQVNEFMKQEENKALLKDGRYLSSYRLRQATMDTTIENLRSSSGAILTKRGRMDDYNTKMQGIWDTVGQNAVAGQILGQLGENKARAQEDINNAELLLDEGLALSRIDEYENNGTFTPEEASQMRMTVPTTISYLKADQTLNNAEDEVEIERAIEELPFEKLTSEQKLRISALEEKAYQRIDKERTRRHETNMATAAVDAMNGRLPQSRIDKLLTNDQISYTQAFQLRSLLSQPKVINSTPAVVNEAQKAITDIGITDPFSTIGLDEQAGAIRMMLQKAAYGDQNTPPSLNGEDYAALVKDLDDRTKQVRTKNGEYQESRDLIARKMGITDFVDAALKERDHYALAYEDAVLSLNDYMRSMGEQADPMEWWTKNRDRFNPADYKDKSFEGFKRAFPEFANPKYNLGFSEGKQQIDTVGIARDAHAQMSKGRMHYWRYARLMRTIEDYNRED